LPEPQPAKPRAGSPAEPRLTPLGPAQRTEEQRELLSAIRGDEAPNLFSTVVRHPALFRTWLPFCMQLLTHSVFPLRERELLIIRTASLCGSAYELEHHLKFGAEVGLTDHDLASVTGEASDAWTRRERLLVAAADELYESHSICDATWRGLSAVLTTEQLVELPMLVGHYILLAGTLRSLGVPLDSEQAEPNTVQ
jgi:alkylhydroperoxidase family enzyme